MRKNNLSSFVVLALVAMVSSAKAETFDISTHATDVDPACRQQHNDPFDLGWRLSKKSEAFPLVCLSTLTMRPVQILGDSRTTMRFANFYHKGLYWTASWNKQTNRPKVQFYNVHFDSGVAFVIAGHTELQFAFPEDIDLVSQTTGEHQTTRNVVISWEAVFPKGVAYNLVMGIAPSYGLAGRVLSLETRVPENILPDGSLRQTDVYDLSLTSAEGAFLFQESVRESSGLGFSQFYETIAKNCTSQLFDILDAVLQTMDPKRLVGVGPFQTEVVLDPIIKPSREALISRGLIKANTKPKNLAKLMNLPPGRTAR